jgi:hypothetical protein
VKWKALNDKDAVYGSCERQLEEVQKGQVQYIIIDVSEAKGTPPQECQDWFVSHLFPGYGKVSSFKGIINVLPQNTIAKLGSKRWKKSAESGSFGFETYETESLQDAYEIAGLQA